MKECPQTGKVCEAINCNLSKENCYEKHWEENQKAQDALHQEMAREINAKITTPYKYGLR